MAGDKPKPGDSSDKVPRQPLPKPQQEIVRRNDSDDKRPKPDKPGERK